MLEGVEVGDAQAVRHEAAGGAAAARADHDAVLPGEVVEVPHDQEVGGVAGLADDRKLLVRALLRDRGGLAEPPLEPLQDELAEVLVRRQAVRHIEWWQQRRAEVELDVALVRHLESAGQRLRHVGEGLDHLLGRLEVVLLGREAPAARVVEARAGLQAQEDVVRLRVVTVDVVKVVGRAQAEAELLAEAGEHVVDLRLLVDAVPLHLEQETVLAEDVAVRADRLACALDVAVDDPARRLALQAP